MQFPLATGNVLASRYLVERLLGAGGMSVVAVATDLTEGQRVALKMLLPEAARSDAVIKRFQREQRTLQQLSSPHTVRLLGSGTEGGYPYMVLEYLEGSDLSDVLKMQGSLPVAEAAEYVLHACEAIAEAHSLGITHRDLKPGNLFMLRLPNGSACIKVLDFGISKLHETARQGESTLTGTAALLGSPFYMSPEQLISSRDVDARTDIWSLGVTLHELLTSALPFGAKTTEKVCKRILNDYPTPLRQFRPDMSQALEEVILRCLKRRPAERYPNIADFALDLAPFAPTAAARESLVAISDFLEPTKRVKLKAAIGHEDRASAPERLASMPRVPLQSPPVTSPARSLPVAPAPARGNLPSAPMAPTASEGADAAESTAILTTGRAAAANAAVRASATSPGAAAHSAPAFPAAPTITSGPTATHDGPTAELGPGLSAFARGASPAGATATAGAEPTAHGSRRFWPGGAWVATSGLFAAATFAIGLGVGWSVRGPAHALAAASAEPTAVVTAAPTAKPKAARETQELDEGFDPIPELAASAPGEPPGAVAPPKPTATAPTVATKPPVGAPATRPTSAEPSGGRVPATPGTAKPPAPTASPPRAPGISEPPEF